MSDLKEFAEKIEKKLNKKNLILGYSLFSIILIIGFIATVSVVAIVFPSIINKCREMGKEVLDIITELFSSLFNNG